MRKDLPTPYPARNDDAAFQHVTFAVVDEPGQFAQLLFGGGVGGHAIQIDARLWFFDLAPYPRQ